MQSRSRAIIVLCGGRAAKRGGYRCWMSSSTTLDSNNALNNNSTTANLNLNTTPNASTVNEQREVIRRVYGVNNAVIRETARASSSTDATPLTSTTSRFMSTPSSSFAASSSVGRRIRVNNNSNYSVDSSILQKQPRPTSLAAAHLVQGRQQGRTSDHRRQQQQQQQQQYAADTTIAARVPVTSIYVARHIDVVAVLSKVFGKMNILQHRFGRTSVTVQFPPRDTIGNTNNTNNRQQQQQQQPQPNDTITTTTTSTSTSTTNVEDTLLPRYIVVFRFGSCVFFNFTNREARVILEEIKKRSDCCMDALPNGFEQREQFDIAISPGLDEACFVTGDMATIKMLDLNNVAVISTVMGQTVALDSYNIYADELLATFATINANVKRTGNFTSMERDALFKVIAQNNSLFIDMVSKLGLKDRSDTVAWNSTQYDAVYQGMRDEFLIDDRFDDIEFKLNLIQQNTKFFLEVMYQNKTNFLEWIIIGLISLECGLMCLEMSGMGHVMFEAMGITTSSAATEHATESLQQASTNGSSSIAPYETTQEP